MTVTTEFVIKLESNPSVHLDGYVDRNDELGEDCDWYYYDSNNIPQLNRTFIEHDDIDGFKGSTQEQEAEIFDFETKYEENCAEISDIILQCDFEDVLNNNIYETNRYGLIIQVTDVYTDCKYDAHDFLCDSCAKCNECGFLD